MEAAAAVSVMDAPEKFGVFEWRREASENKHAAGANECTPGNAYLGLLFLPRCNACACNPPSTERTSNASSKASLGK